MTTDISHLQDPKNEVNTPEVNCKNQFGRLTYDGTAGPVVV
jgi:hypothetical protein